MDASRTFAFRGVECCDMVAWRHGGALAPQRRAMARID
jgi:hypothetical protein